LNSKSDVKPDDESVIIKKEVIATTEEYHEAGRLSKRAWGLGDGTHSARLWPAACRSPL